MLKRFLSCSAVFLTAAAHADVFTFTINSQASALTNTTDIRTPLTGSLIGNYDPTTNPGGTQTRPGLFGGSGNTAIPTTGSLAAVDNTVTHPSGTFTIDVNTQRRIASISNLSVDYLAGAQPDILLTIGFQFATFRTFAPNAVFIGGIPVTLPLAEIARLDALSVEQTAVPALGRLVPTANPDEYTFFTLIPARVTIAGSILNNPIPLSQPVTILLPFSATITVSGTTASASWSSQAAFNRVIPGPLYTIENQPLDVPTVLPPGGTAHLLVNGELGDLTIDLAASGTIHATGQVQTGPCRADFNGDGTLNALDFLAFVNAYAAGAPEADFNGDGVRNVFDFVAFLNAYAVGC